MMIFDCYSDKNIDDNNLLLFDTIIVMIVVTDINNDANDGELYNDEIK